MQCRFYILCACILEWKMKFIFTIHSGGHESKYFNKLPHDLPQHGGFMGCIYDIRLKTENELIPVKQNDRTMGRAVNQCGVSECYKNRCPNRAACLHHGSTFTWENHNEGKSS